MMLAQGYVTPTDFVILPMIGLAAGLFGGLLGVGGGLIMIPAMVFVLGERLGVNSLHSYKLAALVAATLLSIPAARQHFRAGAVVRGIVMAILPGALIGAVLGALASSWFAGDRADLLRRIFGGVMILTAVSSVVNPWLGAAVRVTQCPAARRWPPYAVVVGLPAGLLSGLLGVGGGIWAVPAQNLGLGVRLQSAIANSGTMIVAVAAVAAVSQGFVVARLPEQNVPIAVLLGLMLAPGAMVGGACGASLTHRLPVSVVRAAFNVLLIVSGLRLALAA